MEKIVLPTFEGLVFEENKHIYKLNGSILPSVTTLMRSLSNEVYGQIDEEILKNAAERGTAIHNAVQNFIDFGIEDIPEKYKGYFDAFLAFWRDYRPVPVATEMKMYHKTLRYAGTIDFLCLIDGELYLIDFKSSSKIEKLLTAVQLEGYSEGLKSHSLQIDKKAILHLKSNGKYSFDTKYETNDYDARDVLQALVTTRNYIERKKWGKN